MSLQQYTSKRIFDRTPEPKPGTNPEEAHLRFVVHKHAARALHYDLRLELEGVLKSWAVPKGPSLDPSVKRLAVHVEDHPLDYRYFEGVIPEGNYGAGSVIIWDRGWYHHPAAHDENENRRLLLEGFRKGDLKFVLEGEKLHGEFALVDMKKDGKSWLLLKKKDRIAGQDDILNENRSVLSHKSLEEVLGNEAGGSFVREKTGQIRLYEALESEDLAHAPMAPMPRRVRPMLSSTAAQPFNHADWLFEVKWDGYRAIAELREDRVFLYSRNGISFDRKFSPIAESLGSFRFDAVLDGEIVVVDGQGRPDFEMLQHYPASPAGHLLYYIFDILYLRGHDLTAVPLSRRKDILKKVILPGPRIRVSEHVRGDGILFSRVAREKGLEGIIAKHAESIYEPGSRSRQWLKVKTRLTQDAVITGFTAPGGSRQHFGALVLAAFEQDRLLYIGHVGTGFSSEALKDIRLKLGPLVQSGSPFADAPETNAPVTWVTPSLVCEVAFSGWTEEGVMRQPVFLRLREDKTAIETIRERPVAVGEPERKT